MHMIEASGNTTPPDRAVFMSFFFYGAFLFFFIHFFLYLGNDESHNFEEKKLKDLHISKLTLIEHWNQLTQPSEHEFYPNSENFHQCFNKPPLL